MNAISLNTAVTLVTGATSGIGLALAQRLAEQGATVYITGRDRATLERATRGINPGNIHSIVCDLSKDADIDTLCQTIVADAGRLDILAHCAGGITVGTLSTIPIEDLDWHHRINTRAPLLLTQRLLPLLQQNQGQIVFINSTVGIGVKPGVGAYAASKHALRALADTLRAELNPQVRVLNVYPGNTATPMQQRIQEARNQTYRPETMLQPDDVALTVLNALLLPRTAEVTDIHLRPLTKSP